MDNFVFTGVEEVYKAFEYFQPDTELSLSKNQQRYTE